MNIAQRIYKNQALELAKHHRKYCEGETCGISLMLLKEMAEKSGAEFTDKELEEFL